MGVSESERDREKESETERNKTERTRTTTCNLRSCLSKKGESFSHLIRDDEIEDKFGKL